MQAGGTDRDAVQFNPVLEPRNDCLSSESQENL